MAEIIISVFGPPCEVYRKCYSFLDTPDNLRRWKVKGDHKCGLCGKINVNLAHVLGGCPWVLNVESNFPRENRYLWRHNCVLLIIARAIQTKIIEVNNSPRRPSLPPIAFVKAEALFPNVNLQTLQILVF